MTAVIYDAAINVFVKHVVLRNPKGSRSGQILIVLTRLIVYCRCCYSGITVADRLDLSDAHVRRRVRWRTNNTTRRIRSLANMRGPRAHGKFNSSMRYAVNCVRARPRSASHVVIQSEQLTIVEPPWCTINKKGSPSAFSSVTEWVWWPE
jgi:hypothetical protein